MEDDRVSDCHEKPIDMSDFKALVALSLSSPSPSDDYKSILDRKEKKRSPEWLRAAGNKLREPLQNLISLTGSETVSIRRAVGDCCGLWMGKCQRSLVDSLDTFSEILLILSEDEDAGISNHFTDLLRGLSQTGSKHALVSINRELIDRHLLRMSRIIHRQSEKEQVAALTLLKAQLKALGEQELVLVFSSPKSLDVFVLILLLCVEFNHENPDLLKEEHSTRDYVAHNTESRVPVIERRPWEDFKYFNALSSKVPKLLQGILNQSVRGSRILIEHLMHLLRERPANCAEIMKVIQLVVRTCGQADDEDDDEDKDMMESLLDELLDDRYWNLSYRTVRNDERKWSSRGNEQLRVSEQIEGAYESSLLIKYVDLRAEDEELEEYLVSPQEAKVNVLVTCVLMETVASFGQRLGANRFQKYVFRLLFNLLSNAGNANFCIHSAGVLALEAITKLFQMHGIRELIMHNSDYVMFFVNKSLRDTQRSECALDVISVILEFCSKDVVGYVELIVNRLLAECAKYHRMGNLAAFLKIFGLFLKNLVPEESDVKTKSSSVDEILQSWLAILNPKLEEEEFDLDKGDVDDRDEEIQPEVSGSLKTDPPPKDVEIAQQIMQVALKHISSKSQTEALAAMETLTWGIAILKCHEDALLPLVHQIWAPLALRFNDDNPVVLRNAFQMLITLADSAKDFIHRRTVDEVVPTLNKILKSSWTSLSKFKDGDGAGR